MSSVFFSWVRESEKQGRIWIHTKTKTHRAGIKKGAGRGRGKTSWCTSKKSSRSRGRDRERKTKTKPPTDRGRQQQGTIYVMYLRCGCEIGDLSFPRRPSTRNVVARQEMRRRLAVTRDPRPLKQTDRRMLRWPRRARARGTFEVVLRAKRCTCRMIGVRPCVASLRTLSICVLRTSWQSKTRTRPERGGKAREGNGIGREGSGRGRGRSCGFGKVPDGRWVCGRERMGRIGW